MTDDQDVPHDSAQVFALYELAVEMADKTSERRATSNSFFFAVQAGLAVAIGAFGTGASTGPQAEPDRFVLVVAALAGMVIAGSWWLLLRSYRDLNAAKYSVINQLEEKYLPVQLFKTEWEYLKRDPVKRWRPRYAEQGQVERVVPLIFLVLYASLAVYIAFSGG